ncbi:MAG: low affinity iron permease family protein [Candidatus Limnocylindrales bacterium]
MTERPAAEATGPLIPNEVAAMAEPTSSLHAAEMARARQAPHLHEPRLVISRDVAGERVLDRIADVVNRLIGSMWLFVGITTAIVVWLFAGNIVGFDKTPWPLLLTLLNLPQLSIMISLQVSANRAQAASDARAMADHATLVALHELSKRQVEILDGQNKVLEILRRAVASRAPEART